jgi:hypothetical protein
MNASTPSAATSTIGYTPNTGFNVETVEGETVRIVEKIHTEGGSEARATQVLVADDGRTFTPVNGCKVEEIEDAKVAEDEAAEVDAKATYPAEIDPAGAR